MEQAIIAFIIAIIAIVVQIIKSVQEAAQAKQANMQDEDDDELVIISRPKPNKQNKPQKADKQRPLSLQSLGTPFRGLERDPPKQRALSRELSPQGEGERFGVDPGTLDTRRIVSPTIDTPVKPELESITGIYEEGAVFPDTAKSAVTLNIAGYLANPEGIVHAVILAEILNRPAWLSSAADISSRQNF